MKINNKKKFKISRSYNRSHQNRVFNYRKYEKPNLRYRSRDKKQRKHKRNQSYSQSSSSRSPSSYSKSQESSNFSRSYSISQDSSHSSRSVKLITSGSTEKRRKAPHYHYKKGQKIGHKYKVMEVLGDGTFGRVLKGQCQGKTYAIKVIKPVMKYIKSAKIQKDIVKIINQKDQQDKYGIVRYIQSFQHHRHYCIVFEELGSSLYHVIKRNNYKGFSKKHIKSFFYQILSSVGFLHKLGYTHTDLKPQNILFEKDDFEKRSNYQGCQKFYYPKLDRIRIIDFGSATKEEEHHSAIINTRQYRSPQVLLQCCRWNQLSDVWSIGCIMVQLYTGDLLFDTHQDYEHLAMINKNSGNFPKWMLEDCRNELDQIFNRNGSIKQGKIRKYLGQGQNIIYLKTVNQIFQNDILLNDLLMKCLIIDPRHRISCQQALNHPYFTEGKVNRPNYY